MIRGLLLAAALLPATRADALTCVPPDPLRSFREADASPERYVLLHGRLRFDPAGMPGPETLPPPGAAETLLDPVAAQFEGFALGPDGFTRPLRTAVTLEPTCFGQFCGSIGPGEGWLLFARASEAGRYRVEVDPCGAWAFDRVTEDTLEALVSCLQGGSCGG